MWKCVLLKTPHFLLQQGQCSRNSYFGRKNFVPIFRNSQKSSYHKFQIFANGSVSHFLDGCPSPTGETISNKDGCQLGGGCQMKGGCPLEGAYSWMAFVRCARYPTEQNMAAIQLDGEIYYETTTDILYGSELLVWYGDAYLQFMGIPLTIESTSPVREMEDDGGHKEDNSKFNLFESIQNKWAAWIRGCPWLAQR